MPGIDPAQRPCGAQGHEFEALYRALRKPLYGYLVGALGPARRRDADDVFQAVWTRVWLGLPLLEGRSKVSTWVYAIAHNAVVDAWRSRPELVSLSSLEEGEQGGAGDPLEGDPWVRERLLSVIQGLPRHQRETIVLRVQGHSFEAIARITGASIPALKSRAFQARLAIGERLGLGDAGEG